MSVCMRMFVYHVCVWVGACHIHVCVCVFVCHICVSLCVCVCVQSRSADAVAAHLPTICRHRGCVCVSVSVSVCVRVWMVSADDG